VAYHVDRGTDTTVVRVQVPALAACVVEASSTPSKYQWVTIAGRTPGTAARKPVAIAAPTSDFSSTYVAIPLTGLENAVKTDVRREEHEVIITVSNKKP
jgi:TRAP-type uncharacterized transport system substrate-binding protein